MLDSEQILRHDLIQLYFNLKGNFQAFKISNLIVHILKDDFFVINNVRRLLTEEKRQG